MSFTGTSPAVPSSNAGAVTSPLSTASHSPSTATSSLPVRSSQPCRLSFASLICFPFRFEGGFDGTVRLWDCKSQQRMPIQVLDEAKDSITSITIRGSDILTSSVDGHVRSYDLRKGKLSADYFESGSYLSRVSVCRTYHADGGLQQNLSRPSTSSPTASPSSRPPSLLRSGSSTVRPANCCSHTLVTRTSITRARSAVGTENGRS